MLLIIYFEIALLSYIQQIQAETHESYILRTKSLPEDLNFMPSLSNGHLGYTVFGDSIFMCGVYNGAKGQSRRARIPNWINITANICDKFKCLTDDDISFNDTEYEMNLRDGYFHYRRCYTKWGITLEQRTYPHRYYNRALVYEVMATRTADAATRMNAHFYIKLKQHPGAATDAFTFDVISNVSAPNEHRVLHGYTNVVEFERFQTKHREIFAVFSENFEHEVLLYWPAWHSEFKYQVFVTVDLNESVARKEMDDVKKLTSEAVFKSHTDAWHEFWDENFAIEIDGDLELWRIINAGIFYLANSLPSLTTNQVKLQYFGLSPTGLARGNLDADYQGHSFWDTEIWMLPVITQFSYEWAKELLDYRFRLLDAAQYNAFSNGYKGARYPWESAYTGIEVTNPCCPEVATQEIHISPDIAFALEKYYSISQDNLWLCNKSWPIAHDIAEFLTSRVTCWELFKTCYLLDVMGPDEDHPNVNNNVYTNVVSKIALEFAAFSGQQCGNESHNFRIDKWLSIANQLFVSYDKDLDYHPQHTNYLKGTQVKQADTILLGYPLLFSMNKSTHLNDLHAYEAVTRESGPAMTWSMFAINYLRTNEDWRANDFFERGYKNYVRPEFKVWSENRSGYSGSANFLTGIGGFLQVIIAGYAGIDFQRSGTKSIFINYWSSLPPNVTGFRIRNIRFTESRCIITIKTNFKNLQCDRLKQKFEIIKGKQRIIVENKFSIDVRHNETVIITTI